jgi:hypothetical protein
VSGAEDDEILEYLEYTPCTRKLIAQVISVLVMGICMNGFMLGLFATISPDLSGKIMYVSFAIFYSHFPGLRQYTSECL